MDAGALAFSEWRTPMETTTTTPQKRTDPHILDYLSYDPMTARRATLEAFEFTITGPGQVAVSNASWGDSRNDHTYTVQVGVRDGVALPVSCTCPGYEHHYGPKEQADKHMLALATVGGPTLLRAALDYDAICAGSSDSNSMTSPTSPTTGDGAQRDPEVSEGCPHGRAGCDGPESDTVGCFDCYRPTTTGGD